MMERIRASLGGLTTLYLDIVASGAGVTAESPRIAIRRVADGSWFDALTGSWAGAIVLNAMTEVSSANLPGLYSFNFPQALDEVAGSRDYVIRFSNTGANALAEYKLLEFGPISIASELDLCSVEGVISDPQGKLLANRMVRATLVPVYTDGQGRAVSSDNVVHTYTDGNGGFQLPLVRGATFRLEIDAVGYDRKVVIPDQSEVIFTDL
jgi:hypothetical protein